MSEVHRPGAVRADNVIALTCAGEPLHPLRDPAEPFGGFGPRPLAALEVLLVECQRDELTRDAPADSRMLGEEFTTPHSVVSRTSNRAAVHQPQEHGLAQPLRVGPCCHCVDAP